MRKLQGRNHGRWRGGALLEFAAAFPFLMLILFGTVDFGRAFYYSVTVSNAATTGAFFGGQNVVTSAQHTVSADAARLDAADVGTVTATVDHVCYCPNGSQVNCLTGTCAGYGTPRVYARCAVEKTFDTVVNLPGIPDLFPVRRRALMRAQ